MGTSLPPGLSFSPPLSHLTDSSSVLLSPAVISCQLTGGKKRPINKFNTRSWHLCCSCQLWQTCRQKEWWGNVMALIFTGLNWDIYTNPSQLALHWINTAHVLPKYECVSCKHKFTARVVQRDGDYSSTSKCCVCLVLCTMPSLMQKKRIPLFYLFISLCYCVFYLLTLRADSRILIVCFLSGVCLRRGSISPTQPTHTKASRGQAAVLQGGPF